MYVQQNKNQLARAHNGYAGFGLDIAALKAAAPKIEGQTQATTKAPTVVGTKNIYDPAKTEALIASRTPAPAPTPEPADNTTKYLIAGGIATALILGVILLKK
jgi:hypothetical protein